jgi:hypothetical protein
MLLVQMSPINNKVQGVAAEYPRAGLRAASAPEGLVLKAFRIVDPAGDVVAKLSFAVPNRAEGAQIAGFLGAVS